MIIESDISIVLDSSDEPIKLLTKMLNILNDLHFIVSNKTNTKYWSKPTILTHSNLAHLDKDLEHIHQIRVLIDIMQWEYIKELLLTDNTTIKEIDSSPDNE